jgi:endonuclease/exonuclease/phosphatase family metal-dependent hydrolase
MRNDERDIDRRTTTPKTPRTQPQSGRSPRRDYRGTKIRVVTHNVYGLRYPAGNDRTHCEQRARSLGSRVARSKPLYDVVALQEYYDNPDFGRYTCDAAPLTKAIGQTGIYTRKGHYERFTPSPTFKFNGGVGLFARTRIAKKEWWQWKKYASSVYQASEGFQFARIPVRCRNGRSCVTLDVYNVHLSSGGKNRAMRKKQARQLAGKIKQLSSRSGNPVIVLGDFNIGGPPTFKGNAGYADIMSILGNPRDLWRETHPRDAGYTYDCTRNRIAALQGCGSVKQKRIDYIFVITHPSLTNSRHEVRIAKPSDVKTVKWFSAPGEHVSDHFGLEATLIIR